MQVAIIQAPLFWESPKLNRTYFDIQIQNLPKETHLVVLPELFTSGFTMRPAAVAETMEGDTVNWMRTIARKHNLALTGSLVIFEKGQYYNRLLFVFPNGALQFYDKRHLFTLAGEHKEYAPGRQKLIVHYLGWRLCPLICYDLRFPVFSRCNEDYEVLIYVANWPKPRVNAWDSLLKARAIENMCYTIGVNRIGEDHNQQEYNGHSQVSDFLGNYLIEPQEKEGVYITTLNKKALFDTREKFGFLKDRDAFTLTE